MKYAVVTDHPVAYDSPDHQSPWGTKNDDTHAPAFVAACVRNLGSPLRAMDIGCSSGGIVEDWLTFGHEAIGLEGSDYSKGIGRASWGRIPDNLFTCDVGYPFQVLRDGEPAKFDVISAWAFLEHVPEASVPVLFRCVMDHLVPGGLFVGSISNANDPPWHINRQSREWWAEKMMEAGFSTKHKHTFEQATGEYARTDGFRAGSHGWPFVVIKPHG